MNYKKFKFLAIHLHQVFDLYRMRSLNGLHISNNLSAHNCLSSASSGRYNEVVMENYASISEKINDDRRKVLLLDGEIYRTVSCQYDVDDTPITLKNIDYYFSKIIPSSYNYIRLMLDKQGWYIQLYLFSLRELIDLVLPLSETAYDAYCGLYSNLVECLSQQISKIRISPASPNTSSSTLPTVANLGIPLLTDFDDFRNVVVKYFLPELTDIVGSYIGLIDRKLMIQYLLKNTK